MVYAIHFLPENYNEMLGKIQTLLKLSNLKQEWRNRRKKMLSEKIDVTAFLIWFVENYPESHEVMKNNQNYQVRFK